MKKLVQLSVLLTLSLTACNLFESTSPSNTSDRLGCSTHGVVKAISLDGCSLLIVKDDGQKLIPVSLPGEFELKDGQEIMFDYLEEPMMNNCMAGPTVKVTCIKEIKPRHCDQQGTLRNAVLNEFDTLKRSSFILQGFSYANGKLTLEISYSGCNPDRHFELVASPVVKKSYPPQQDVKLVFEDQMCEALFQQKLCIDVSSYTSSMILIVEDDKGRHSIRVGD